jgi:hypothetical protein
MFVRGCLSTVSAAMLALGIGCAASMRASPPPSIPASNAELVESVTDTAHVTAEQAYRCVYVLWKGSMFEGDFASLTSELESSRIIDSRWDLASDALIDRATVGYMVCRACDIHGLNWDLTGMGRYAWRELQYRRIGLGGGELGLVSGGEFVGILTRAEDYLYKNRKAGDARPELGEDPTSPTR